MKKLFSVFLATAIAICGAGSVYAEGEPSEQTGTSCNSLCSVTWEETYNSLDEVMENSDICMIGTVISQEVEQRYDLYFTHSYVQDANGEIFDVLQTGAVIGNTEINVPYDISLLEIGSEYFLCLNQTDYDEVYGQYYLIAGGNQGYGLYQANHMLVSATDINSRTLFSTFCLEPNADKAENITIDSVVSESISNVMPLSSGPQDPADYCWNIWDYSPPQPIIYLDTSVTQYGSTLSNGIKSSMTAWNSTNGVPGLSIGTTSFSSKGNVNVYMFDLGDVGYVGLTSFVTNGETCGSIGYFKELTSVGITLNRYNHQTQTVNFWKSIACHEMGHGLGLVHRGDGIMQIRVEDMIEYTEPTTNDINALKAKYISGV